MNKTLYKVAGYYVEVAKQDNYIILTDEFGQVEEHYFKGSIKEFMKDTFNTYEVASIA